MLNEEVQKYLDEINSSPGLLKDHQIAGKIRGFIDVEGRKSMEDNAEIFAFNVYTDESNNTSWGSYFGPMMSFADKNGEPTDFPSLDTLSKETLAYWFDRFNEVDHPYLRARYADLLIEFEDHQINKVSPEIFNAAIDAHISLSKQGNLEDIFAKQEIERAYFLAKKYKQKDRLSDILNLSVSLESKIAQDDKPGLWGFTLEWFLLDERISISEDVLDSYLSSFEERRLRLLKRNSIGPLESATIGLVRYYKFTKNHSKAEAVLDDYERCVRNFSEYKGSSLGRLHYLQSLEEIYLQFNFSPILEDKLKLIQTELSDFRLEPDDDHFKEISVTQEIPKEKIEELFSNIFDDKELSNVILRIVLNFFQRTEREKQTFKDLNSKYVFAQLTTGKVFDMDNRLIATLPPLNEAPEMHFIKHCSQNLQINAVFLSMVSDKLTENYKAQDLIELIKSSGLHNKPDESIISTVINLYWGKKYFEFAHVAVPFVESSIRRLFMTAGMSVQRKNKKTGGYEYRPVNKLLQDQQAGVIFKTIFDTAGEDLLHTINMIFTEKLGLNIRNNLSHGIHQIDFYNRKHSDQILLVILILSLIKIKE